MKLPYQRLYLRMSLYIGAALLAFIGLAVASVVAVASLQLESYIATRQSTLGQTAADVLARGGRPAEAGLLLRGHARINCPMSVANR